MKHSLLRFLWVLLMVLTITACSEEESAPVAKVDDDHLLTDHAWKTKEVSFVDGNKLTDEEKEQLRQKYTYETLLFKTDGKFIIESNYGQSIKYGGWYLYDDHSALKLNIGYNWTILELSEKALTVYFADSILDATSDQDKGSAMTVYFVHKD